MIFGVEYESEDTFEKITNQQKQINDTISKTKLDPTSLRKASIENEQSLKKCNV